MKLNQLYGEEYRDFFTNAYGMPPKYIPNLNLDKDTGELLEPPVLFTRNPEVPLDRPPVTFFVWGLEQKRKLWLDYSERPSEG